MHLLVSDYVLDGVVFAVFSKAVYEDLRPARGCHAPVDNLYLSALLSDMIVYSSEVYQ